MNDGNLRSAEETSRAGSDQVHLFNHARVPWSGFEEENQNQPALRVHDVEEPVFRPAWDGKPQALRMRWVGGRGCGWQPRVAISPAGRHPVPLYPRQEPLRSSSMQLVDSFNGVRSPADKPAEIADSRLSS